MSLHSILEPLIAGAYSEGRARFGDLGLELETYASRVLSVTERYLGSLSSQEAATNFIKGLHGRDLYLATACAQESLGLVAGAPSPSPRQHEGRAWKTLELTYRTFISDLARFFFRSSFVAQDLADNILADLFFPDRTGTSRIVSYDGRSSLSTWLRVVVCNQAINAKRRSSYSQSTEISTDIPDLPAWNTMDRVVRFNRYEGPLRDALATACRTLAPRERLILLWRYQEGLQLGQIAELLGIHQSNVTRQLDRLKLRFRNQVIAILTAKHGLSGQAIQECFKDLVENPVHTIGILDFLKASPHESERMQQTIPESASPVPLIGPRSVPAPLYMQRRTAKG